MLPIYGAGGLLLEQLHRRLRARSVPRWGRSLAYMAGIYSIELGSAALLNRVLGDVPWRYRRGINVRGYVRIDYAPFWYLCGWLFESLESELRKMGRPSRKTWRPLSARAADAAAPRRSWPVAPAPAANRP